MNIPFVITLVYLVFIIGTGVFYAKRTSKTDTFLAADSHNGAILIACTLFSTMIGGSTTYGAAATGFTDGFKAMWTNFSQASGLVIWLLYGGKIYANLRRKYGFYSNSEEVRYRFGTKTEIAAMLCGVVMGGLLYSTTPRAIGSLLSQILNIDLTVGIIIAVVLLVGVAMMGGMKGMAIANIINTALIFIIMTILMVFGIKDAGGLEAMKAATPATHWSLAHPSATYGLAICLSAAIPSVTSSVYGGGQNMAHDWNVGKKYSILTIILLVAFAPLPCLLGIAGRTVMPDADPSTIMYAMAGLHGGVWAGLASVCVVCASFSTACGFLMLCVNLLTRSFFPKIMPNATDKQTTVFGKLCVPVVAIIFLLFGLYGGDILGLVGEAFSFNGGLGVIMTLALFWKKGTKKGAYIGVMSSLVAGLAWYFLKHPWGISTVWITMLVGLVVFVAVSLIAPEEDSEYLQQRFRRAMSDSDETTEEDTPEWLLDKAQQ